MVDIRDHPRRRVVVIANPAAQGEITITVPGQEIWVVESLAFRLVADATVATRVTSLAVDDGGVEFLRSITGFSHTAGLTMEYCAFRGSGTFGSSDGKTVMPWPSGDVGLSPGMRIKTVTSNLQVGDQFSRIRLLVMAYPTGPRVTVTPGVNAVVEPRDGTDQVFPSYTTP